MPTTSCLTATTSLQQQHNSNLSITYHQAHSHHGLTPLRDSHAGTVRSRAIHNPNTLRRGIMGHTRARRDAKEPPPFNPLTQRARPGLLQAGGAERCRAITGAVLSRPPPPPPHSSPSSFHPAALRFSGQGVRRRRNRRAGAAASPRKGLLQPLGGGGHLALPAGLHVWARGQRGESGQP